MNKRVTIVDIAREAGVSVAQVGRALSEKGAVKPETREQIRQVAERMGYRVNHAARQLASKHSRDIGVVIGEPLNPFHIIMAGAINAQLRERDLISVVSLRGEGAPPLLDQIEHLLTIGVAGVILISTDPDSTLLETIAQRVPTVYFGQEYPDVNITTLSLNEEDIVGDGIRHLIQLGHRRIAHIDGGSHPGAEGRRRGYAAAMLAAGLEPRSIPGGHELDDGRNGVDRLLDAGTGREPGNPHDIPTAIFADNDLCAIGAINRLYGRGLRVPEDVSVLGFDDMPYAASETMSLSTFRQDIALHAKVLVTAVEKRIKRPTARPLALKGTATFVLRRSITVAKTN